jgi:hypothetical protein
MRNREWWTLRRQMIATSATTSADYPTAGDGIAVENGELPAGGQKRGT